MSIKNSISNNKSDDFYHASKLHGFPIPPTEHVQPKKQQQEKTILPKINANQKIDKKIELQQNNDLQKCLKIVKIIPDTAKKLLNDRNELIKKLYDLDEVLYYDKSNNILVYLDNENKISVSYHGKDIDNTNIFIKSDDLSPQDWEGEYYKIYNALQLSLSGYQQTLRDLIENTKLLKQYNLYDNFILTILKEKMDKFKIIAEQIKKQQQEVEKQYQEAERRFKEIEQKANQTQSPINNSIKANKEKPPYLNPNNQYNFDCYKIKKNNDLNNQNHKPFGYLKNNNKQDTLNLPFLINNHGNNLNQQHQMNKEINYNANQGINNFNNKGFQHNENLYNNQKSSKLLKINNQHNIKIQKINIVSKNNDNVKENKIKPANNQIKLPPINKKIKLKEIKLTKQQKILKGQDNILAIVNNQLNKMDKNHLSDSLKQAMGVIATTKQKIDNKKKQLKVMKNETKKELAKIKKEQLKMHQIFVNKANNNDTDVEKELNELEKKAKQEQNDQNPQSKQNIISKKDINDEEKALEDLNNFLK